MRVLLVCWLHVLARTALAANVLGHALIGVHKDLSLVKLLGRRSPASLCGTGCASHAMNVQRIGKELHSRGHSFTMYEPCLPLTCCGRLTAAYATRSTSGTAGWSRSPRLLSFRSSESERGQS